MNISIFIAAIAMVESGNNPAAVGKAGELSEYQITRQVRRLVLRSGRVVLVVRIV